MNKKRYIIEHDSEKLENDLKSQAKRLGVSKKEYVKMCVEYFVARQLDPEKYNPQRTVDIANLVERSLEKISDNIGSINRNIESTVWEETKICRLWVEALSTQITELMVDDRHKDRVQKEIVEFIKRSK